MLARLREIAAAIAADAARENATLDAQKASCLSQGKGFTDPRTGVHHVSTAGLKDFQNTNGAAPEVRAEKEESKC